jgi:hypothetical protein
MIKSREVRWTVHVVCLRELRNAYRILAENLEGRDYLEDMGADGRIILKWILRR